MPRTPAINPNSHAVADKAKYEYVRVTLRFGAMHRRLSELADAGLLDDDESFDLQVDLYSIWEIVCEATMFAVLPADVDRERDWDTLAEDWNTYSDGRTVITRSRIEPRPRTDPTWPCNQLKNWCLEFEDVGEQGVIYYVAHPDPAGDQFDDDVPQEIDR